MGENIDEVVQWPEWRCPVCRDICNCSGANCLRARRNLFPTNQLVHEANRYNYPSVSASPSVLNPKPLTLNPKPLTLTPKPLTLNPKPFTLNPTRHPKP